MEKKQLPLAKKSNNTQVHMYVHICMRMCLNCLDVTALFNANIQKISLQICAYSFKERTHIQKIEVDGYISY